MRVQSCKSALSFVHRVKLAVSLNASLFCLFFSFLEIEMHFKYVECLFNYAVLKYIDNTQNKYFNFCEIERFFKNNIIIFDMIQSVQICKRQI